MYSQDFRALAVRLILDQKWSYNTVATTLKIGKGTVHRWVHHCFEANLQRKHVRCLPQHELNSLNELLQLEPCTTLARLQTRMQALGYRLGRKRVSQAVRALGFTKKRTTKRIGPQSPDPAVCASFHSHLSRRFAQQRLIVSIDESYFSEKVLPLTGFSKRGSKCVVASNQGGWSKRSLLLAVASDGSKHYKIWNGSVNKERFVSFVLSLPYPPGTVIVLDNVSFHKIKTPFVAKGFEQLHSPPYSPDDNGPVENSFSKIKSRFRSSWPWPLGVDGSIVQAVETVCEKDIIAAFGHLERRCNLH